jgi:hypothetical protein
MGDGCTTFTMAADHQRSSSALTVTFLLVVVVSAEHDIRKAVFHLRT